ncbi:MAG: YdcF family protein, partial [Pseudomonadota bacterium]
LTSALLVSDPLHLRRAQIMAWDLGIDARPSATPSSRYQTWSTQGPFLLREVFYIHVFWVFGQ